MRSNMFFKVAGVALVALSTSLAATLPAIAANDAVRVRGAIVALNGDRLVIKSREGGDVTVVLTPSWKVSAVAKASLSGIRAGDFVGIASLPTAAGGDGALEVLIFPPAMKGTGEGSYGWDLKPDSTMTNGSVADAVTSVDGRTVTVMYHGKSKKISIPAGAPIVTFVPATPPT